MSSEKSIDHEGEPNYGELAASFRAAKEELTQVLKQRPRVSTSDAARKKVEVRLRLFAPLAQVIERLISEKLGDIRKPGQKFELEITSADIQQAVDPEVFKAFEEDLFDAFSGVIDYLENQGVIEDMSGSLASTLVINYSSSEGEIFTKTIVGRQYKRGSLFS